jgi:hypothetical protein
VGLLEVGILLAGALAGWLAVSWVMTIVRQQREAPVIVLPESRETQSKDAISNPVSLREVAETWHTVLQVRPDASVEEIKAAYYARIMECDRVRFSKNLGNGERQEAERRRLRIDEAYNFIRTSRDDS